MTFDSAMTIVKAYGEFHGMSSTLDILEDMQANYRMLSCEEQTAFNTAFDGFRKLFHG